MAAENHKGTTSRSLDSSTVDAIIRFGLIGLIAYWSLKVIGPFLTIALWSAILTVALYPMFERLARYLGSRRLAAALVTLLCLMVVIGPVTWLGLALIGGAEFLVKDFDASLLSIPPPPEAVKG
jgi:predicted PurR-regulated permease PerM